MEPHRRTRRREVEADEDRAVGLVHRRRIPPPRYLDLTGLPPTADDVRAFLADTRDTRLKRDELIDKLIGSHDFIDHWTNKWADLLQVNRKFLGEEGRGRFRELDSRRVAANMPYDQFVRKILTASGSNPKNPARVVISRFSASRRTRWRTRRICSWPCGSTATSATITRSNAGPRTSIIRRPPSSPRSIAKATRPAAQEDRRHGCRRREAAVEIIEDTAPAR